MTTKENLISKIKELGKAEIGNIQINPNGVKYRFTLYVIEKCPYFLGQLYRKLGKEMATRSYANHKIVESWLDFNDKNQGVSLTMGSFNGEPDGMLTYKEIEIL